MESLSLLRKMVEIESHSGQEQNVAQFIVKTMQELGFEAHIDSAGNAVGYLQSEPNPTEDIILLGHMDTVPGHVPVREEEGKLYGRGSVDAKGPLATFIAAASQIKPAPGKRLVVIGAVEEEVTSSKGARQVAKDYQPAYCIIGEPSGFDGITLGYKGALQVHYTLTQGMSHTAGPASSVGEIAIEWWKKVQAYCEEFNQEKKALFDQLLPTIRSINTSSDGLEEKAHIVAGFRLPLNFSQEDFLEKLSSFAPDAQIECFGYEPAYRGNRSNPLVRAFMKSFLQSQLRPIFKVKTGTSDMNVVGPVWNCPIVAYGPGDSDLDHTPHEHIEIEEYHKAIDILKKALQQLCH